jgi:[acyl-carrier-protein] S-malonyltransferase
MRDAVENINITFPASIPCISNVSALPFQSKEDSLERRSLMSSLDWKGKAETFDMHGIDAGNVMLMFSTSKEDIRDLLSRQCIETVRWWDSIRYLHQERGVRLER